MYDAAALQAVDAQRFMEVVTYLHMMWSAPYQITLALYFLYDLMGPSVFSGQSSTRVNTPPPTPPPTRFSKWLQHGLRCFFAIGSQHYGCWGSQPKHVSNPE